MRNRAIYRLEAALVARIRGFSTISQSLQSRLAVAAAIAEAGRAEQNIIISRVQYHPVLSHPSPHLFWVLSPSHCSLLRTGWRMVSAYVGNIQIVEAICCLRLKMSPLARQAELRRLWK